MRVQDDPLAVTTTGTLVLNLTHVFGRLPLPELIEHLRPDAEVFVGVVLPAEAGARVLDQLADAMREVAAFEAGRVLWSDR